VSNPWNSRWTARAFRTAIRSRLFARHIELIDDLSTRAWPEVLEWQEYRLRRILSNARRFTSYYRDQRYAQADLESLPILGKDFVRAERKRMRNRLVPARATTTGGSGGPPLLVYISHASFFTEWAHVAYAWRFGGVSPIEPKITLRGSGLGEGFRERRVIYQEPYNQLLVSPFHLTGRTFRELLARLRDFPAKAVWGYPSAIAVFAQWVLENGPFSELRDIKAILLASEMSFDWQLRRIEDAFGAKIVRWYGQTEKASFAAECQLGSGYHLIPTYGITEVVDGRVVGTGFTNAAMPLVRYDTEDHGAMTTEPCVCGLPFPRLLNVTGRSARAMLWGYEDEPISLTAINFHDPIFVHFSRFQFKQERPGQVTLLVVPADETAMDRRTLAAARNYLENRASDRLEVEVAIAEPEQLLTERGKALAVDQRYSPGGLS
jgi:phenylacetate-CoA ligase